MSSMQVVQLASIIAACIALIVFIGLTGVTALLGKWATKTRIAYDRKVLRKKLNDALNRMEDLND